LRVNIILLVATILIGAGLTFWFDNVPSPLNDNVSPMVVMDNVAGDKVPDFEVTDISGRKYSIEDFRGKIVLVNFWATWCAPCVVEFPKLIELANAHKDELFLKKNRQAPRNFVIARDIKRKITTDVFQTYKLPETLIISPSGKMVKKIVGDTDWGGQEIQNLLSSLK